MSREPARFQIIDPHGIAEEQPRLPSAGAVLSRAQNLASRSPDTIGTWIVREYEDDLYAVERLDSGAVETRPL